VITDPPLLTGAVNATVAVFAPVGVAVPIVGAEGAPIGIEVAETAQVVATALTEQTVTV
jgi:hypothetical protein